jgi:hypothetical protein
MSSGNGEAAAAGVGGSHGNRRVQQPVSVSSAARAAKLKRARLLIEASPEEHFDAKRAP